MSDDDRIVTRCTVMYVDRRGILRYTARPGAEYTAADAREDLAVMAKLAGGRPLPAIVDLRTMRAADRDARNTFAGPEIKAILKATAIVVNSALGRVVVNFYLAVSRPTVLTQLFSTEEEALAWIEALSAAP